MNRFMKLLTILLALAVLFAAACGDSDSSNNESNNGSDAGNGDLTDSGVPVGAPKILFVRPIDKATGVSVNTTVNVTFDREMDAGTFNNTSFGLKKGDVSVAIMVVYKDTTATLTPLSPLENGVTYTATVSTDVTDVAGKALESEKVWSFTTMLMAGNGPAAVDLGTAGDFVILAKSGISTTGTTAIVGDIAVSPVSASYVTGFSIAAPPTTHAKSPLVTGKILAADYDPPTPTKLTVAVLDMEGAYTDAAGRTLPDFTEHGAGNVDTMTLTAGLYKWGTNLEFANGVTLNGSADDVWIFQIAQDLQVGNGAIVTLSGGAQAKNVFWQVGGQVTIGTTARVQGILLTKTMIEMKTGAVLLGRAFAQTAVTLDGVAVTQP